MTDLIEIAALRARLAAATPGTWFAHADDLIGGWCVRIVDTPPSEGPGEVASFIREEDARFIAHARADVDALVAEVERLRAEVGILQQEARIRKNLCDGLASEAAEERAAVVAWLRAAPTARMWQQAPMDDAADHIERGEHCREEER